jgi:dTDP-4-dehydrorhamnose reductase
VRVVVVGAGGQLGTAIVREFSAAGAEVIACSRRDVDVTDFRRVGRLIDQQPDLLINCTAFNDVDGSERAPEAALATNAHAVRALALVATNADAAFVHFSTDFVFDGTSTQPHVEEEAVRPLNWYGRSKAIGEWRAAAAPRHYVLRLSSVFGGREGEGLGGRSSVDRMIDDTRRGNDVVAFGDRTVTPSYAPDVARATRLLVESGAAPGVYHCANSGETTWLELAHAIADALEAPPRIRSVRMTALSMPTPRPLRCALSIGRLEAAGVDMPSWRDALERHIASRCRAGGTSQRR